MIFDSHCHAWQYWPYKPTVPDFESRGTIEQLLHEMNIHEVDRSLIVCAEIDQNPENNIYVMEAVARNRDKLSFVVDVDSSWKDSYHQPGAVDRLKVALDQFQPDGITHYLKPETEDGAWLHSEEGLAFFTELHSHGLIASIACGPKNQAGIRKLAEHLPELPIIMHHMAQPQVLNPAELAEVLLTSKHENVYVKISGFYYLTSLSKWDYPLADVQPTIHTLYNHFGAQRMCWGTDYPVVRGFHTYRHAIEIVRTHCRFIPSSDMEWVMGKSLAELLSQSA